MAEAILKAQIIAQMVAEFGPPSDPSSLEKFAGAMAKAIVAVYGEPVVV